MADQRQVQTTQSTQGQPTKQEVELNEFMLHLIEILNKRLGSLQSQISSLDRRFSDLAVKTELEAFQTEYESTKTVLLSKITDLEGKLRVAQQQQPAVPKVNQGILKHLE
jgi:hypothetical protein